MRIVCLALILIGISHGCRSARVRGRPSLEPTFFVESITDALHSGDPEKARMHLREALRRYPEQGAFLTWSALIEQMFWREDNALQDLLRLHRRRDYESIGRQELMGRIGDLLFRLGRYAESIPYLFVGQEAGEGRKRRALLQLARALPYSRSEPRELAAELPLIGGMLPRLLCSFGDKQRSFVLDTGATFTTVTRELARDLKVASVTPAGDSLDGRGQRFPSSFGVLPSFSLGSVELESQPVLVVDDSALSMRDPFGGPESAVSGLVGLDVLARFHVTFDPERRSVVFAISQGLDAEGSVQCIQFQGNCLVPVQIEGRRLWFILDTGASHSSLTEAGLLALPGGEGRAIPSLRRVRTPGGVVHSVSMVPDLSLSVSNVRFGVDLPVVPRDTVDLFPTHGVLGADLIMRCRTTFDGGRILLVPSQ